MEEKKEDKHLVRGKAFEDELEESHQWYAERGMGVIVRLHVPMAFNRRTGRATYLRRTLCDYMGFIGGGRAVLLEAKSLSDKDTKTWKPDREHQFTALTTAAQYGAMALYIIRVGTNSARLYTPRYHTFDEHVKLELLPLVSREISSCPWHWLEEALKITGDG